MRRASPPNVKSYQLKNESAVRLRWVTKFFPNAAETKGKFFLSSRTIYIHQNLSYCSARIPKDDPEEDIGGGDADAKRERYHRFSSSSAGISSGARLCLDPDQEI